MTHRGPRRRIRLRRDAQQWEFDRAVRDTGRVYHFQPPGGGRLPPTVRMHDMISKHIARNALRLEKIAAAEAAASHKTTALEFYYDAALAYANAQHPVLVNNAEKKFLHGASIRCYDEVRRLAPTTIEHLDIPWGGTVVSGNLHLAPGSGRAPLVFYIPGCDMTKEFVPHPLYNWANQRGMHLFVFDGPGQGESNIRDIKLTVDNYEDAAAAALTHLLERDDVDAEQVALYAQSFGSYWGVRFAARESRLEACVFAWASICDKYHLFEEESPRYKQLFAFLTGATDEAELDRFIAAMGLEDHLPRISSPSLFTVGEYDPRSPLEEVYALVDTVGAPFELWVYADQHHVVNLRGINPGAAPMWQMDTHSTAMDWICDRFAGHELERSGQTTWLELNAGSPNDPATPRKRRWFED
jgi:pimeloyl-ACP methyl ester carboxylesterase